MLTLTFDRKHRVLLATVSGIFTSEDLDEFDQAMLDFVVREDAYGRSSTTPPYWRWQFRRHV